MHTIDDLTLLSNELIVLKALADRELQSVKGLTGELHTPHIDKFNRVSIQRAEMTLLLKQSGQLPFSEVELISEKLSALYPRAKNKKVIEFDGERYQRRYSPLKLSKSGKSITRWAKYWLKLMANGDVDRKWQQQVKEIWPTYFVIKQAKF